MGVWKLYSVLVFAAGSLLAIGQTQAQDTSSEWPRPQLTLHLSDCVKDSIHLRSYFSVFVDKSAAMPLSIVRSQPFMPLDSLRLDTKYELGRYAYWFFFAVENTGSDSIQMSLNIGRYDSVQVFSVYEGRCGEPSNSGLLMRGQASLGNHLMYLRNQSVMLRFPPSSVSVFLVRGRSWYIDPSFHPILFRPASEAAYFFNEVLPVYVWNAGFMGILLLMLFNTMLIFSRTSEKSYLFYAGYILMHFMFYWRVLECWDFFHILPAWFLHYQCRTPVAWAWAIFYLLFLESFFDAKRCIPQLHRWLLIGLRLLSLVFAIYFLLLSIDFVLAWKYSDGIRNVMRVSCLVFLIAMMRVLKKDALAQYILTGSIIYAFGSIGTGLAPETSLLWDNSLIWNQLGILGEVLFFNLALSVKTSIAMDEKERVTLENQKLSLEKELEQARIRAQIAQDIHDEVGASLTKLTLAAQVAALLPKANSKDLRDRIERIGVGAQAIAAQLREIVFATNPDFDLFEEMQAYFRENTRDFWADSKVQVLFDFETNGFNPSVAPQVKRQLLLIFKEAQNNAAKYSGANKVHLTFKLISPDSYILEVQDNGNGFDKDSAKGFTKGLSGMKKRAESIGATFLLRSELGKGTTVRVEGRL